MSVICFDLQLREEEEEWDGGHVLSSVLNFKKTHYTSILIS
jgi:hypothetical protein